MIVPDINKPLTEEERKQLEEEYRKWYDIAPKQKYEVILDPEVMYNPKKFINDSKYSELFRKPTS